MAITLVNSDEQAATGDNVTITLTGTQGNLQVIYLGHRAASQTASLTGTGWNYARLVETETANSSWRRGIAMCWRTVPASAGTTTNVAWDTTGPIAAVGYEFSGGEAGTWSIGGTNNSNDSGQTNVTSLSDGGITSTGAPTVTTAAIVFRHGDTAAQAGATNLDVSNLAASSDSGSSAVSLASGYDTNTGGEQANWAWTTSAAATAIIDWFDFAASGGGSMSTNFDGVALDNGWSFVQATSPTAGTCTVAGGFAEVELPAADGWDSITSTGSSDFSSGLVHDVSGDFDLAVRYASTVQGDNSSMIGFIIRGATDAEMIRYSVYGDAGKTKTYGYARSGGSGANFTTDDLGVGIVGSSGLEYLGGQPAWLRVERVGTTYNFYSSPDGALWILEETITSNVDADTIKLKVGQYGDELGLPIRFDKVVDLDDLGSTDARTSLALSPVAGDIQSTDLTTLPAWLTTSSTGDGSATHSSGKVNISTGAADGSNGRLTYVGAGHPQGDGLGAGMLFRMQPTAYSSQGFGAFGLAVLDGGPNLDMYSASPLYGIELKMTNVPTALAIRVHRPVVNSLPVDEPYVILTFDNDSTSNNHWWRIEKHGELFRYRHWADGSSEPSTWEQEMEDDVLNGEGNLVPYWGVSHNPGSPNSAAFDIDDITFYSLDINAVGVVPGVPTSVSASAGNSEATITWTDETVGVPNPTYTIERRIGAGAYSALTSAIAEGVETYSDSTAVNGTTYQYRVLATNSEGSSAWVESNSVTPASGNVTPNAPTLVLATAGNAEATLTWVDETAGIPNPTYTIERRVGAGSYSALTSAIAEGVQTYTDSTVINGTTYQFRILATNSQGSSGWVESNSVTPIEVVAPVYGGSEIIATGPPTQEIIDDFNRATVQVESKVDIYEYDGFAPYAFDVGFQSGSVSVDMSREERRNLQIIFDDPALAYGPDDFWYDKVVRPYRGIRLSDGTKYFTPLGTFYIDSIARPRFPATLGATCRDRTKMMKTDFFADDTVGVAFPEGDNVVETIRVIAINNGLDPRTIVAETSADTLSESAAFAPEDNRWSGIKELADSISYICYFDAYGVFNIRPSVDPLTAPISHTFLTGENGNLIEFERTTNDSRLKNDIVVMGSEVSNGDVYARATNTDASSPTSVINIGRRTVVIKNSWVASNGAALTVAQSRLSVSGLESYDVSLTSLVAPWMEAGEAVEVYLPDAAPTDPVRFLLNSFAIPPGIESMSASLSRVTIVV